MAYQVFIHLGVSFDVRFLHTHHLRWIVVFLSLNSPPIPIYRRVPSCWALVFVVVYVVAICPTTSFPSASPLMEILLLWTHPYNHVLPVEVVLPVLFLCLDMCEHGNLSVIPASTIAPARCVTNFSLHCTCSWKGCDPTGAW